MLQANRYVLLTSFVGALTVLALLGLFRHVTLTALVDHETRSNVALTSVFVNLVWPGYRDFAARAPDYPRATLAERPEIRGLHRAVTDLLEGSSVVQVKLHAADGLTVFSSDAAEIGGDVSADPDYRAARAGQSTSRISFLDGYGVFGFSGFEAATVDRNVVSSFVPVRDGRGGRVAAVFEVHSNVTPLVHRLRRAQWTISVGVLSTLTLLYALVFAIVRRADRTIRRQNRERVEREARIRHQSCHDALTGLPNRANLAQGLRELVGEMTRTRQSATLLAIGLDRFKLVNDSLGHELGDEVLRRIGARLARVVRGQDTIYRTGGDEFAVVPRALDDPSAPGRLAERILIAIGDPIEVEGHRIIVSASIGIASSPNGTVDAETLTRHAIAAMGAAKEMGGNTQLCYHPDMNARSLELLALQTELKQAAEQGEFVLHYQPRVDARTRRIVSLEALLRWRSPKRGLVGPDAIIPVLERTGLINEVGEWVLREACRQANAWRTRGLGPEAVSVNVSARQFLSGNLAASVGDALARSELPAESLELEITESVLISSFDDTVASLREIKALGVGISIDDFGTGYSSFEYLKRLPVDKLKLDRSLVHGIVDDSKDLAIVRTIAALAHGLGFGLVAEGVEHVEQEALLAECRCDQLQGFLYGRPAPAREIERRLMGETSRPHAVA